MSENRLKSVELTNGLTLEVVDRSRRISEDAFLVKLLFKVDVEITDVEVSSFGLSVEEVKEKLKGDTCHFEVEMERNFIFEADAGRVKEELVTSYLKTNEAYLGHKGFASGLIRRRLVELQKRY